MDDQNKHNRYKIDNDDCSGNILTERNHNDHCGGLFNPHPVSSTNHTTPEIDLILVNRLNNKCNRTLDFFEYPEM
jgi:hypothetical protein